VFGWIFAVLALEGLKPERIMTGVTASSLLKKGLFPAISGARKAA
jgi:hypothetical protein